MPCHRVAGDPTQRLAPIANPIGAQALAGIRPGCVFGSRRVRGRGKGFRGRAFAKQRRVNPFMLAS